MAMWSKIALS